MVEFTCAAPANGITVIGITATPPVEDSVTDDNILNEHREVTLSFIAPANQTIINIACVAVTTTTFNQRTAVLMIQGR